MKYVSTKLLINFRIFQIDLIAKKEGRCRCITHKYFSFKKYGSACSSQKFTKCLRYVGQVHIQHCVRYYIFNIAFVTTYSTLRSLLHIQHCVRYNIFNIAFVTTYSTLRSLLHIQHCVRYYIFNIAFVTTYSTLRSLLHIQHCVR